MIAWESAHTDLLVDAPEALLTNFFGFNSGGKMSGLFDFVLVTADLRAGEESIDGKSSIIGRILDADQITRQLDGIVTDRLSVSLFAEHALLVEGETEAAVFYGVGDRDAVGSLESQGLSVVSAGSKGGIPLAHAILTCLGIPTYVLFDGDGGFEARAKALGKKQTVIDAERMKYSTENRRLLRYLDETEVEFPADQVGDRVATLSDHLESYLDANWPEWGTSYAAIEAAAGIRLAKNQYAYRTATLAADGTVPEMLKQILTKAVGA